MLKNLPSRSLHFTLQPLLTLVPRLPFRNNATPNVPCLDVARRILSQRTSARRNDDEHRRTIGNRPLASGFIDQCLETIEGVIVVFGEFVRDKFVIVEQGTAREA